MDALSRRRAAAAAEDLLTRHGVDALPVDVYAVAEAVGVRVVAKPDVSAGVSGALIKIRNDFVIAYATHVASAGFRRFSVGHELGHLHIPGHAEALLSADQAMHESRAGYRSGSLYEREADEFSANLLMPTRLFRAAMRHAGDGLPAVLRLAEICEASRLATAIRYVKLTAEPMAVIVSEGPTLRYVFLSDEMKEFRDLRWPRRNAPLPSTATADFNRDLGNVSDREHAEFETPMSDWFGGNYAATLREEVVGLGRYGRTLTVLTSDVSADEEEVERTIDTSWQPQFRR